MQRTWVPLFKAFEFVLFVNAERIQNLFTFKKLQTALCHEILVHICIEQHMDRVQI